jgi:NADH-quinone oxidoreductase subunit H
MRTAAHAPPTRGHGFHLSMTAHFSLDRWIPTLGLTTENPAPALLAPECWPCLPQRLVEMALEAVKAPDWLVTLGSLAAAAGTVVAVFLSAFALLSLIERKVLARVQNRLGPNRAGYCGILQPVADGIKMLTKEDIVPTKAEWFLHLLAPILIVVPSILALGVIPYGREWLPVPLDLGMLFFFAVGTMTEVAVFIAGWASGSKFPMLGAMRAIAQMVSYELPLMISALSVVMISGTLSLAGIVDAQAGTLLAWNILTPWGLVAGLVFFIAAIAESNRCPFDLPEGESEIVAGHMTEYSGFKYALFFMGEYLGLFAISGLGITLFLGGWQAPLPGLNWLPSWLWFFGKLAVIIFVFLWIRATFPRVRIDQLMRFAWLCLIPVSLLTLPVAGIWHYAGKGALGWLLCAVPLLIPFILITVFFNRRMAPATRRYHFAE